MWRVRLSRTAAAAAPAKHARLQQRKVSLKQYWPCPDASAAGAPVAISKSAGVPGRDPTRSAPQGSAARFPSIRYDAIRYASVRCECGSGMTRKVKLRRKQWHEALMRGGPAGLILRFRVSGFGSTVRDQDRHGMSSSHPALRHIAVGGAVGRRRRGDEEQLQRCWRGQPCLGGRRGKARA